MIAAAAAGWKAANWAASRQLQGTAQVLAEELSTLRRQVQRAEGRPADEQSGCSWLVSVALHEQLPRLEGKVKLRTRVSARRVCTHWLPDPRPGYWAPWWE